MTNADLIAEARRNAPESVDESLIMRLVIALEEAEPRVVTTMAEMNALPFESVVTDAYGTPYVCEKHRLNGTGNEWVAAGTNYLQESQYVLEHGDVTVRYEPEAEATR